jgi:hypothetical protein
LRTEWLDKHVEPSRLCGPIEDFFKAEGFTIKETFTGSKHRVEALFSDSVTAPFAVVEIYGDPNRIVVDFLPWGRDERTARNLLSSSILTILGGGILVRQDLKRKELMEKVENQFWASLDRFISEQTG